MSEPRAGADSAPADERWERAVADEHCITCGDEGIVMRVLELVSERDSALCAGCDGVAQSVAIDLVGPVAVGDDLLVHAGVAISAIGAPA